LSVEHKISVSFMVRQIMEIPGSQELCGF